MNKQRARKRAIPAAPTIVKRKVPRRRPNSEYRNREYLSEKEVGEVVAAAATQGRHGLRDSTLILIGYALRRLQREDASATYVFVSERKAPLTIPALERAAAHLRDAVRAYTNVLDASRKVKVWLVT